MNSPATVPQNLNDFFALYARALENHDTKAMAFMYHVPCTLLSDDTCTVFNDPSKLEGFFNHGITFYKHIGIVFARSGLWSQEKLAGRIVKAKVNWQYLDTHQKAVYNCDYHFVLKLDKLNHWKIILSVSVNEKERLEEWQKGQVKG